MYLELRMDRWRAEGTSALPQKTEDYPRRCAIVYHTTIADWGFCTVEPIT